MMKSRLCLIAPIVKYKSDVSLFWQAAHVLHSTTIIFGPLPRIRFCSERFQEPLKWHRTPIFEGKIPSSASSCKRKWKGSSYLRLFWSWLRTGLWSFPAFVLVRSKVRRLHVETLYLPLKEWTLKWTRVGSHRFLKEMTLQPKGSQIIVRVRCLHRSLH